jgi:hypothetical protein
MINTPTPLKTDTTEFRMFLGSSAIRKKLTLHHQNMNLRLLIVWYVLAHVKQSRHKSSDLLRSPDTRIEEPYYLMFFQSKKQISGLINSDHAA